MEFWLNHKQLMHKTSSRCRLSTETLVTVVPYSKQFVFFQAENISKPF